MACSAPQLCRLQQRKLEKQGLKARINKPDLIHFLLLMDSSFALVLCPHHCREAVGLTEDKVTPTAVVDVFTIWITEIIPLIFGNMLPESLLTSTAM